MDYGRSNAVRMLWADDDGQSYGGLELSSHVQIEGTDNLDMVNMLIEVVTAIYQGSSDQGAVIQDKTLGLATFEDHIKEDKVIPMYLSKPIVTQSAPRAVVVTIRNEQGALVGSIKYKLTICDPKTYPNNCALLSAIFVS